VQEGTRAGAREGKEREGGSERFREGKVRGERRERSTRLPKCPKMRPAKKIHNNWACTEIRKSFRGFSD
jgi:hypothetical protein